MQVIFVLVVSFVICTACGDAVRGDASRRLLRGPQWGNDISVIPFGSRTPVRELLQRNSQETGQSRATNTLRSESATADAIARAVESGSQPVATKRASVVGGTLAYAAANSNSDVFDQMEYNMRGGP
jgi:hypothetical protein